jgi:hypothetical protein
MLTVYKTIERRMPLHRLYLDVSGQSTSDRVNDKQKIDKQKRQK